MSTEPTPLMIRNPVQRPVFLLALVILLSGCFHSREIQRIRDAVEAESPGTEFEGRFVVSLGPVPIQLTRWIVRLVDDPDARFAGDVLRNVRRVKLGVFEANRSAGYRSSSLPRALRRDLERNGWELALQVREEGQMVWIFFRERRGTIRDVFITVADQEELVIVRFKGRLDRILERAMDQYGPLLPEERPDSARVDNRRASELVTDAEPPADPSARSRQ